jgi:hypothetical protein
VLQAVAEWLGQEEGEGEPDWLPVTVADTVRLPLGLPLEV